jgi:hypothetical protein
MTPFYKHLSGVPGFGVASDVDKVGVLATAAVGAAFVGHGLVQIGIRRRAAHETATKKDATPKKDAGKQGTP